MPKHRRGARTSQGKAAHKWLGQHFLIDTDVLQMIIETAQLQPDAQVLEIGPGHGVLTEALAQAVPQGLILTVEKDRDLVEALRDRFKHKSQVKVVVGDILGTPLSQLLSAPYQVVANLPYNITSPVITKFLLGDYRGRAGDVSPRPSSMTLLIQKEVAERLTATPTNGSRGVLTVIVELFGTARLVRVVPPEAFDPPPRVESAIIRLELGEPKADPQAFLQLLKAGFANKRRQLHNSLGGSLRLSTEATKSMLDRAGINALMRAEQLTLDQWLALLAEVRRSV